MQVITPRDKAHWLELRSKNINSTDVSSLFGVNPYCSEFELWHRLKEGTVHTIEENDRMFIGSGLETAIANMAAKKNDWQVQPLKSYFQREELRLGSSFDFMIVDPTHNGSLMFGDHWPTAILEIKNVDYLQYKKTWIEEGDEIEAPPHIELQVQTQLLVSGLTEAYLCALVGGNDLKVIHRKANPSVHKAILSKVAQFWKSIEDNAPPKINFEIDAEFVASLHNYAEPNSIMQSPTAEIEQLVRDYKAAGEQEKLAQTKKKACKAEILTLIGTYEKVKGDTFSISAGMRGPVEVAAHTREGFRDFRVFLKGGKE